MNESIIVLLCVGLGMWSIASRPKEYDWLGRILCGILMILVAIYIKL